MDGCRDLWPLTLGLSFGGLFDVEKKEGAANKELTSFLQSNDRQEGVSVLSHIFSSFLHSDSLPWNFPTYR